MIEVKNGVITSWDGSHSKKSGVKKAYSLWKALGFLHIDKEYRMIKIEDFGEMEKKPEPFVIDVIET